MLIVAMSGDPWKYIGNFDPIMASCVLVLLPQSPLLLLAFQSGTSFRTEVSGLYGFHLKLSHFLLLTILPQ